jgi:glutathione S-transferase
MTITLYGVTRSRASRTVWLCLEAGIPFEQVPVIQARRVADPHDPGAPLNTQSASFLEVNPNGLVPALKDGDLVLTESLAINLYLAKKAGPPLGPRDLAEDGQMTMWSFWAATEAEPHAMQILLHCGYLPEAEREPAKAEAAAVALAPKFAVLDRHLRGRDWLVADRFTVADVNTAEVLRYAGMAPELFAAAANVKRWYDACQARPAFMEMMRRREAEPA